MGKSPFLTFIGQEAVYARNFCSACLAQMAMPDSELFPGIFDNFLPAKR